MIVGVSLIWAKGFDKRKKKMFDEIQAFVDRECINGMNKYVPVALPKYKNAGSLKNSVRIESPGKIIYTSKFAKHQYYDNLRHEHTGNPHATRLWFETMKTNHKEQILRGAAAIARRNS